MSHHKEEEPTSALPAAVSGGAAPDGSGEANSYPSPARFEEAIEAFEEADRKSPTPDGAIVCVGSSSMAGWHTTIHEDLAPLTVIPRGFGGSNMNDALHYIDRIVLNYSPRAIVIYEGDNDLAEGISPRVFFATLEEFMDKVHAEFPKTRIYVLSIKPSDNRWHIWPTITEANQLVADQCTQDDRLFYIDLVTGMLGEDGMPRKNIFQEDNQHMTRPGYEIWRDAVRPILIKNELPFEQHTKVER